MTRESGGYPLDWEYYQGDRKNTLIDTEENRDEEEHHQENENGEGGG